MSNFRGSSQYQQLGNPAHSGRERKLFAELRHAQAAQHLESIQTWVDSRQRELTQLQGIAEPTEEDCETSRQFAADLGGVVRFLNRQQPLSEYGEVVAFPVFGGAGEDRSKWPLQGQRRPDTFNGVAIS